MDKDRINRQRRHAGRDARTAWAIFMSLICLVSMSAVGVVYSSYESRKLRNELQHLERQRNALQVEWGQLLLEQSSMVSQGRIENLAQQELGMVMPAMDAIVVVKGD